MYSKLKTQVKKILPKILPDSAKLRYLAYLPKTESFRKAHTEKFPILESRYRLYDFLNQEIVHNKSIDYIEFGVFKGDSIKYWASINSDTKSKFYGFDTFTGLPDTWQNFSDSLKAKAFDTSGEYPHVDDARVSFIKGLFQESLPDFLEKYKNNNQLVIHNDCDLYSATLYVLTYANSIINPGTIIIFDEFWALLHEFRALEDYCSSYMRNFKIIGATLLASGLYAQIAIKME